MPRRRRSFWPALHGSIQIVPMVLQASGFVTLMNNSMSCSCQHSFQEQYLTMVIIDVKVTHIGWSVVALGTIALFFIYQISTRFLQSLGYKLLFKNPPFILFNCQLFRRASPLERNWLTGAMCLDLLLVSSSVFRTEASLQNWLFDLVLILASVECVPSLSCHHCIHLMK